MRYAEYYRKGMLFQESSRIRKYLEELLKVIIGPNVILHMIQ